MEQNRGRFVFLESMSSKRNAITPITSTAAANTSLSTPQLSCEPISSSSSSFESIRSSGSAITESVSAHDTPECPARQDEGRSIALRKPTRACSNTGVCRYEPSPSGIRQDTVSCAEFFAAVNDPDLEDATIISSHSVDSRGSGWSDFH